MTKIPEILNLLDDHYGVPPSPDRDPVDVLIRGILSQNTTDANSKRAFDSLLERHGEWEEIRQAPLHELEKTIRCGGLARQKAITIQSALTFLHSRGGYCLDFLREMPIKEAEQLLTTIKGVGVKTARLVLLFGLGRPAFVVDTHVLRVSRRLGLIEKRCGRVRAHTVLGELIPPQRTYTAHMNIIKLGRNICRPRNPACVRCPVKGFCLHFKGK